MAKLTWDQIKELSTELAELEASVFGVEDDGSSEEFCLSAWWEGGKGVSHYESVLYRVYSLVGSDAKDCHPALRNTDAYYTTKSALYDAIFGRCRGCDHDILNKEQEEYTRLTGNRFALVSYSSELGRWTVSGLEEARAQVQA